MGLLTEGTPLRWPDSLPYLNKVKMDGVEQFLHAYHGAKDFKDQGLKWGDEVEYLLLRNDSEMKRTTLLLRAPELLEQLQKEEHAQPEGSSVPVLWRVEYPRWMIEGTPGVPYRCYAADLVNVERNMVLRRSEIQNLLGPGETVLTLTAFPRTGCGIYTTPTTIPFGEITRSYFISDDVISIHPRFATLAGNIYLRRGRKVKQKMPLFVDRNTKPTRPLVPQDSEHLSLLKQARNVLVSEGKTEGDKAYDLLDEGLQTTVGNEIIMDNTAFGMGACCLQVTLQGRDLSETRYLYDQLAIMAPIMLALTAATPILRGYIADTDVRWDVISSAMDDRTLEESESGRIPKSRYSSIDAFLSCRDKYKPGSYNDIPIPINKEAYNKLREGGVDHLLAQHIAHLFIRDPIAVYAENVNQDNTESTDHFENIQSTNWNTVRFKLPPPNTDIGWRTEFRSMEVGLTDFENAAFSVFTVILSRVILAFNLNFYVPMSKVDENMATAHRRDAAQNEYFYFRKNVFKSYDGSGFLCNCGHIHNASLVGSLSEIDINRFCANPDGESSGSDSESEPYETMTLDQIFNGKPLCQNGQQAGFAFPGLIPLMRGYVDALGVDSQTRDRLLLYLDFISERASGALCTNANFMRRFVRNHKDYAGDSVVSQEICYDLIQHLKGITAGKVQAPELLGRYQKEAIYSDVETPDAMMERMMKKLEGPDAGLLYGSSMPRSVLDNTIRTLALGKMKDSQCGCT